ncbi:MAG: hypothetical protein ACLP1D_01595 [Xanthobacteraceae bacterium]
MNLHVTRYTAGLLWLLAALFAAGEASAHGGLAMEKDYCKLRVGPYVMHFTGYQPGDGYRKEFCEDIPATGQTIVILDFIDDALRDLPVAVRIVLDDGGGSDPDSATVYQVPPKIYPKGTFSFDYQFQQPGRYVGLITVGDGVQQAVGRFPFSVGVPFYLRYSSLAAFLAVGFGVIYGFWRWRGRRAAKAAAAT